MKNGRGRIYRGFGGMQAEIEFLSELRLRAHDLMEDLPDQVLTEEINGHSIEELFEHMLWAEAYWFGLVADVEGPQVRTIDSLGEFTAGILGNMELDARVSARHFTELGQVVRHVEWHWSYHAAQMGMLRKQLGYPYKWLFAEN